MPHVEVPLHLSYVSYARVSVLANYHTKLMEGS